MARRPNEVVPLAVRGVAPTANDGMPIWAMGFRPFFLMAGVSAVLLVTVWVAIFRGQWIVAAPARYLDMFSWHFHEMIFGFAAAVIAGFLLTAASNWTGQRTAHGPWLIALVGLWLAGRVVMLSGAWLAKPIIAAVDLAFLPALIVAVGLPIVRTRNWRNLLFIILLTAMTIANVLMHLQALGAAGSARRGGFFAIDLIIIMIAVVGGRVFPYFASKRLPDAKVRRYMPVEIASIVSLALLMFAELLSPMSMKVIAALAGFAALANGVRFIGWLDRRVWGVPLLWVLYTGYAWLIIGLMLRAGAALEYITPTLSTHALTVGAIGVLTLGMMARVSLGHTGRALQQSTLTTIAFVVINLSAVLRALGPLAAPHEYAACVAISGGLWAVAFAMFLITYTPIFIGPRIDGRAG